MPGIEDLIRRRNEIIERVGWAVDGEPAAEVRLTGVVAYGERGKDLVAEGSAGVPGENGLGAVLERAQHDAQRMSKVRVGGG